MCVGTPGKSPSHAVNIAGGVKKGQSPSKRGGAASPQRGKQQNGKGQGHGSKRSGSMPGGANNEKSPMKVVVKGVESGFRAVDLGGGSASSSGDIKGLGHDLLTPSGMAGGHELRDSTSSGTSSHSLALSGDQWRTCSKSKPVVKQMPDSKREATLKELLSEQTLSGPGSSAPSPSGGTATPKSHLNMVVIGHVDSGKSTTMGHLLFLLGHVAKKTIDKFERESKTMGKATFHFAWVMDERAEERARGVTIDVAVHPFETERHKVTILDAPGHQDFVPNMISGASQADVAVLVVNASDAEYASILDIGSAKEHILLARSLGVSQLIIAINKLDTCGWQKERFESVKELLYPFLKKSGFKDAALQFIPTSGLSGENLIARSDALLTSWYTGLTLIEAINNFQPAKRDLEKPFRLSVHDVFKDAHSLGVTIAGKIESGFVTTGDKLFLLPQGNIVGVRGLRVGTALVDRAAAGVNVEIGLTDIEEKMLGIGDVLCDPCAPVPMVSKFQAQLVTFDLERPIIKGQNIIYYAANLNEPAKITKLIGILDNTGAIKTKNPRALPARVTSLVEITLHRKVPAELYKEYRGFGRFTVRDSGKTLAAGIITEFDGVPQSPSIASPSPQIALGSSISLPNSPAPTTPSPTHV